jgi:hypothetical protein
MRTFLFLAATITSLIIGQFATNTFAATAVKTWCDESENSTPSQKACCNALDLGISNWCKNNPNKDSCSQCVAMCKEAGECKGDLKSNPDHCASMCMWKWCGDGPDSGFTCPSKEISAQSEAALY